MPSRSRNNLRDTISPRTSSSWRRTPLRELTATPVDGVLVEATPPHPEDQRTTRSRSNGRKVQITEPHGPERSKSRSNGKRSKREPEETLVNGIPYEAMGVRKKSRTRVVDETLRSGIGYEVKRSKNKPRARLSAGPNQSTLTAFLNKHTPASSSNTAVAPRSSAPLKGPLRNPSSNDPSGSAQEPISILSDTDDEAPSPPPRIKGKRLRLTDSQASITSLTSPDRKRRLPSSQRIPRTNKSKHSSRRTPANGSDSESIKHVSSPNDWTTASLRKSQSCSPVQSTRSNRVLVEETITPVRVLVPETMAPGQAEEIQVNPFYVSSPGRSPVNHSFSLKRGVGASIDDDSMAAGPSRISTVVPGSSSAGPSKRTPAPSASQTSRINTPTHPALGKSSSITFGDDKLTPRKSDLLANLGRSPTVSPAQPSPPAPNVASPPPQMLPKLIRKRAAFIDEADESYRPMSSKRRGKLIGKKNALPVPPPAVSRPTSRPKRVSHNPGQYKLPEPEGPMSEYPSTRVKDVLRPARKRRSDVVAENMPTTAAPPPAEASSSQLPTSQQSVMSSLLTPPPQTQAPPLPRSASPCPASPHSATPTSPQSAAVTPPVSQPPRFQLSCTPSHPRLVQLSQHRASQSTPSKMSLGGALPSSQNSISDFLRGFDDIVGLPCEDDPGGSESPLARRGSRSPVISDNGERTGDHTAPSFPPVHILDSPVNLAARLLEQEEEETRRQQALVEQQEREREERIRGLQEQHKQAQEEQEEEEEEEVAHDLWISTSASRSASPLPPPRWSKRVVVPKAVPQEATPRPKKLKASKEHNEFRQMILKNPDAAERGEWELAMANMAERRCTSESVSEENELRLRHDQDMEVDVERLEQEDEDVDRCEERFRELEAMPIFWATEDEHREPILEADLYDLIDQESSKELWDAVAYTSSGMLLPLLSSGILNSLSEEATPSVAEWLFKIAFGAEDDLSLVASQQLCELLSLAEGQLHPFGESIGAYQHFEAVWRSLCAVAITNDGSQDRHPTVDVRIGREAACMMICELTSAMASTGWLLPGETEKVLEHLIKLAIDPNTSDSLSRAIVAAANILVAVNLQCTTLPDLAVLIAKDIGDIPLYHQSKAVLALGQGTPEVRALVALLATAFRFPDIGSDDFDPTAAPSKEHLLAFLDDLIDTVSTPNPDWIEVGAMVTMYAAAAADSGAYAIPPTNKGTKYCPFVPSLARAQLQIKSVEQRQPRAMVVKSRLSKIEGASIYAAQLAWTTKNQNRLAKGGLTTGHDGQAKFRKTWAV